MWGCVSSSVGASAPFAHGHRQLPAAGAVSMPTSREEVKKEEHSPTPWNGTPNSSQRTQPGPRLVARSAWIPSLSEKLAILGHMLRGPGGARLGWKRPFSGPEQSKSSQWGGL